MKQAEHVPAKKNHLKRCAPAVFRALLTVQRDREESEEEESESEEEQKEVCFRPASVVL